MRLLAQAKKEDPRVWLLMVIQYWHAGRNSEMIHLTRDNFQDGFIHYERLKGSKPCSQKLVAHADPLLDEKTAVFEFVRNSKPNQRLYPRSRWTYWRHLVKLAIAAGIPRHKAKTTVLKHSICTHLIKEIGVPAAQRRAGHVNGANTLRYAEMREEQVDELVDGLLKA
jgi:site-specific recombinase XerD